jgi:hypothetical protein
MLMISTPADMKWLREVHLPGLERHFKSAVIHGNEDSPGRIDVYSRKNPLLSDIPLVYVRADEGGYVRAPHLELGGSRRPVDSLGGTDAENDAEYTRGWQTGLEMLRVDPAGAYKWEATTYLGMDEPSWFDMGVADVISEHRVARAIR